MKTGSGMTGARGMYPPVMWKDSKACHCWCEQRAMVSSKRLLDHHLNTVICHALNDIFFFHRLSVAGVKNQPQYSISKTAGEVEVYFSEHSHSLIFFCSKCIFTPISLNLGDFIRWSGIQHQKKLFYRTISPPKNHPNLENKHWVKAK